VIFFGGYFYVYKKVNPEKVNKLLYFLIHDLIDYVVLIFFVLTFVLGYVAPGKVDGNSMRTTLDNDNSVLVWHFAYKPKVGDVVVVNMNEVQGADGLFIKRVRATEGDILKFKKVDDFNYNLYNNEILIGLIRNSDVKRILTQDISLEDEIIYAIPKEKFLMIGDNWDNSTDSRFYGLIDYKYCLGKAFFCISKMKWL
jgi:signal peptidase I